MEILFECKPTSNWRRYYIFNSSFGMFVGAIMFIEFVHYDYGPWWWMVLSVPLFVLCAIWFRNEIFGGIIVGADSDNLVIHRKDWPHLKDKRIPLDDIAEVVVINPREAEKYIGYSGPMYNVKIQTKSGRTYRLNEQLTPEQLEILQKFEGENCK